MDTTDIFSSMMDSHFTVEREEVIKKGNMVIGTESKTYGPYPCRVGKKTGMVLQTESNLTYDQRRVLYCLPPKDIVLSEGDLIYIESDPKPYILSNPYFPSKHHYSIEIERKGDT